MAHTIDIAELSHISLYRIFFRVLAQKKKKASEHFHNCTSKNTVHLTRFENMLQYIWGKLSQ